MTKPWKVVLGVTAIGEGETLAAQGIGREPAASEPPTAGLADGG